MPLVKKSAELTAQSGVDGTERGAGRGRAIARSVGLSQDFACTFFQSGACTMEEARNNGVLRMQGGRDRRLSISTQVAIWFGFIIMIPCF